MPIARFAFGRRLLAVPALVSIALGLGAVTLLFSIINGVFLTPLPYHDAERLVLLRSRNVRSGAIRPFVSILDFQDWRRHTRSFEAMALYRWMQLDLPGRGGTERVHGLRVTPEFFGLLGLSAHVGALPDTTSVQDESRSIVLSRSLWRRRFGEDVDLVGKTIDVNSWESLPRIESVPHRVLAVVEEASRYLPMTSGLDQRPLGVDESVDFWLPMRPQTDALEHREYRGVYGAVARLAKGVTSEQAEAELRAVAARLAERYPDTNANWSVAVVPLKEAVTGSIRPVAWLLLAGVALLLAISCSNVASLQLVRTIERERELAIRRALGASAIHIAVQIGVETLFLVVSGGALGVVLSVIGLRWLKMFAPPDLPRLDTITIDTRVLLFALALSLATGLATALAPVWHASVQRIAGRASLRSQAAASLRERTVLHALAALAIGMTLVLLIGAGLLQQSLRRLLAVDPGYDPQNVITMTVSLPESKYPWIRNTEFVHEVISRLSGLPGVDDVGAVRGIPGRETRIETSLSFSDSILDGSNEHPQARIRVVTPTYFRAMRIPLVAGRGFEARDESGETGYTSVVLVNETFAERFWPGESAIEKRLTIAGIDLPPMKIIGVVGDVRYGNLDSSAGPEIYYPEALFPQPRIDVVVRTGVRTRGLRSMVEAEIRAVEPDVLVSDVETIEEVLHRSVADRHFVAWLLSVFSLVAFLLAVVGVVGVVARNVARKRRDIGIRIALGARASSIMRLVLGRSLVMIASGVAIGLSGALTASNFLSRFLYSVESSDGSTYLAASLFIVSAALLASYFPARRAACTNPLEVLRDD